MFDRLFTRPTARARHRDGPLAPERLAYLTHLANRGASLKTLRVAAHSLLAVIRYLRLAERPGTPIQPDELDQAADRWAGRRSRVPGRRAGRSSRPTFVAHATGWLRFLGRLVEPTRVPGPFDAMIEAFTDHLFRERGLSPHSVRGGSWVLRRFLHRLGTADGSLRALTITQFDDLFSGMIDSGRYARVTVRHYAGVLRAFFRYAETRGWCRAGLAAAIQGPACIPKHPCRPVPRGTT